MRGLLYKILIGIAFLIIPAAYADDYSILILPDNIVSNNISVDSFLYNETSEFFADEIIALLNNTEYVKTKPVSFVRKELEDDNFVRNSTKHLISHFKSSYNIDYYALKRIANKMNSRYVLLLTSSIDAENYILRRTVWDFLNIPGATVVDPAYKISTYGVLIDVKNNRKLWSDTYYKTISVCENRIISRGFSPQTEQLSKIKDYSRYICPQIARQIQMNILPEDIYASESCKIDYDLGNIDNVFTKKYRHLGKENKKIYKQKKSNKKDDVKKPEIANEIVIQQKSEKHEVNKVENQSKPDARLEVEAKPIYEEKINARQVYTDIQEKNAVYEKKLNEDSFDIQSDFEPINIRKNKTNNLWGKRNDDKPLLRDYN